VNQGQPAITGGALLCNVEVSRRKREFASSMTTNRLIAIYAFSRIPQHRSGLPKSGCVLPGHVSNIKSFASPGRLNFARYWDLFMSDFATARHKMVDGQVRPSDVTDIRIIEAMLSVPRELFVPESQRPLSYLDLDLEVSEGRSPKRFLLRPVVTAKSLQAAGIGENDDVLVVGCASGYAAALAAKLARRVTATESDRPLAEKTKSLLASLGLGNVRVNMAAASEGDSASGPFDVIILNGATEIAPEPLYRQLKEGGRLVGAFAMAKPQRMMLVTASHGDFGHRVLFDTEIPVLPGLERAKAFVF
jgi:protein-L-isoaspartate(D-aspartate) O-methyltransferase